VFVSWWFSPLDRSHHRQARSARSSTLAREARRGRWRRGRGRRGGRGAGGDRPGRAWGGGGGGGGRGAGRPGGGVAGGLVGRGQGIWERGDVRDLPGERRRAGRSADPLALGRAGDPERARQRRPRLGSGLGGGAHQLRGGAGLAGEVGEIKPQDAEEAWPAVLGTFELVVPIVAAGEETVHHPHDADAAG